MFLYLIVCLSVIHTIYIPTDQSKMDIPEKLADRVHTPMTNKTHVSELLVVMSVTIPALNVQLIFTSNC
jgi:hypothetical protein